MEKLMELFVLLRYILLSALVTTILIRIFYYLKNQLNHKKIIKQILTSVVFALGLFIVMYSVYSEDNKHNFYDTRMIYLTFIAITYQPFSIILTIILAITTVSFYLTGVELLIFIVSLFIPLIVVYGCRYLIKKKDLFEFNFYENILLLLLINILFLIPIHFMVGLNLNLIITKLLFNPFIFSLIIFVNKKLNTYYSLSESYSYKNKMINEALESTKEFEIYILDTSYNYVYFNLYHQEQMAYFNKAIIQIGDNFIENVLHIDVRNRLRENIDLALNGQKIAKRLSVEDRRDTYLEEHYVPVYNKKQQITYITVFSHNVTNQVNYEKQINFLSYYDGLTKLLNRRSLNKNISQYNKYKNLTIIFFDVNNLKFINDVFGHLKGDEYLNAVTNEIKKTYQDFAQIYRVGGDEFIVVYSNEKLDHFKLAIAVKDRLSLQKVNNIPIKISMGLANRKNKESFDQLLSYAEGIMYEQKIYHSSLELTENINILHQVLLDNKIITQTTIDRLTNLAKTFKNALKMNDNEFEDLKTFIRLHNIGLISADNTNLIEEEKYIDVAYRMLSSTKEYNNLANDVINQYENYDGSGVPQNLSGDDISLRARILRIIKTYDQLVNQEVYSEEDALAKLKQESGKIFDPNLVNIFIKSKYFKE